MPKRPSSSRPARVLVDRVEQVRALHGPLPHRMVAVWERLGACSVAELAAVIGETPEVLYYHVRRLVKVGLIVPITPGDPGRRAEAIYELPGRELVFDHRQTTPAFLDALANAVGALLRLAERTYREALPLPHARRLGARRNLMLQQHDARLSPRSLSELNRRLEDIATFVAKHDDPARTDWISLTMVLAPRPARTSDAGGS